MYKPFFYLFFVFSIFISCKKSENNENSFGSEKPNETSNKQNNKKGKLGAYYFGAGYFTLVPKNIQSDLDEMKSLGTDFICIGITENDIQYNKGNIAFIIQEAHERGMEVFAVPSRMAGITAGQPIEPPLFGYHFPHTATIDKNGKPVVRKSHGILSSFYHPEVKDYFLKITSKMLNTWSLDGIVWDEPKSTFWQDFSPLALAKNPDSSFTTYLKDFSLFLSDINLELKKQQPDLTIILFDEACRNDTVVEILSGVENIDYFGTDGRPVLLEDTKITDNRSTKILPKYGERFLTAARKAGKKTMMLVENQELTKDEVTKMDKAFPEILKMDLDMLIYYYYGFYDEDPEYKMNIIRKHIVNF